MPQNISNTTMRRGIRLYQSPFDGEEYVSVTSALQFQRKEALERWKLKAVADRAIDEFEVFDKFRELDTVSANNYLLRAPDDLSNAAIRRGTLVHGYAEKVARKEEMSLEEIEEDIAPYVYAVEDFITHEGVEFIDTEFQVYNTKERYAGTVDAMIRMNGKVYFLDYKTTMSGVWPDMFLQLVAYGRADQYIANWGAGEKFSLGGLLIVHLDQGKYEIHEFIPERMERAFEEFRIYLKLAQWSLERQSAWSRRVHPSSPEKSESAVESP